MSPRDWNTVSTRPAPPSGNRPILAAGAVVLRPSPMTPGDTEVLVIHRACYDDWTLPKGHRDPGEHLPVAAVREVFEETGVPIRLGARLPVSRYPVNGHPKEVHWWVGVPTGEPTQPSDDEADVVDWLPVEEVNHRLTFETDRHLVARAVELSSLVPFLLVRHAKALARAKWKHEDVLRPLTRRGRVQARDLTPLLKAFGVAATASADAVRCIDTLVPYARTTGLEVQRYEALTEHAAADDPQRASTCTRDLARAALGGGAPTAVCGHRPVLPVMLESVQVDARPFSPGDCVVAYLDNQGNAVVSDHFEAPTADD